MPWEKRRGDLCPQSSQKTRLRTDRIFPCAPTSLHVQQPQHTEPMLALVATSTLNSSPKSATQKAMTSYQNSGGEGVHMTQQESKSSGRRKGDCLKIMDHMERCAQAYYIPMPRSPSSQQSMHLPTVESTIWTLD